jgi:hypothetical protein
MKVLNMIIAFLFVLFSCRQESKNTDEKIVNNGPKPYVYVAGYYQDGRMSMENQACFWVNGKRTDIGNNSKANGLAVVDGNVYVAITQTYNYNTAHYWVDGERMSLNLPDISGINGTHSSRSRANSITVDNDVIYVAGAHDYKNLSDNPYKACYWQIRQWWEIIDLPGEAYNSEATAIFVEDGKLYIAGYYTNSKYGIVRACYWADNERIDLPGTDDTYTTSMAVKNGKVYIVGYTTSFDHQSPCYWVDGEAVELVNVVNAHNKTIMTDIAIKEDKVYITCSDCYGDNPYYLIDGEKYELSRDTYSTAEAITVVDNKVYIAGCADGKGANNAFYKACYWVDGKQTILETGKNSYVGVTSIAVIVK